MDKDDKTTSMIDSLIPGPAYRIETSRLVLRCWDPRDALLLKNAVDESLDHLRPWMPWAQKEPEALQVKVQRLRAWRAKFDANQDFAYGIFNLDETLVLGATGLHTRIGKGAREIGYWIHQGHAHQGLATEAVSALIRVGFEIDELSRIEIHCNPKNEYSSAIPRHLGFVHEATLRRRFPGVGDVLSDTMIWTLFKEDYAASPAAKAPVRAYDVIGQRII